MSQPPLLLSGQAGSAGQCEVDPSIKRTRRLLQMVQRRNLEPAQYQLGVLIPQRGDVHQASLMYVPEKNFCV